ncbi:zinc-binding dehydrogenase, partial [Pseudonocardia alaniniphila]
VRSLGADRVIDTDRQPLDGQTGVFDVVIDAVGREVPEALFAALRRGGRLITLQEPPSEELADEYGVTALFFIVTAVQNGLARIADMIDAETLKVGVAATFLLAEGRTAYESGALRRSCPGKTVLVVRG